MIPQTKMLNSLCRLAFSLTMTIFNIFEGHSQQINISNSSREDIFNVRIKQFNEFVDRFNFKTDFNGNPIDSLFRKKMPRNKMLASLFDFKDGRILKTDPGYSKSYEDAKSMFIEDVVRENRLIDKYSDKIIAEARSRITYNGIPQTVTIYLNQEITGKAAIKWVMLDVKGEFMNIFKTDTSLIRFISPGSNETDFINLKRALEDSDYVHYYAYKNYTPDFLSIFLFCVGSKIIRFEYVEEIRYHILDIPGWCIKIKDFNRNELNSGWLIFELSHNNLELKDYIKSLTSRNN